MRILAVDTAGERLSLALSGSAERVCEPGFHDKRIFKEFRGLLKKARLKMSDLDAVAVCTGPGRFTGIRVGMTFCSMLARSLGKPLVGVSRFEVLARSLPEAGSFCVELPALAGEFYFQLSDGRKLQGSPQWAKTEGLEAAAKGRERVPHPGTEPLMTASGLLGPAQDKLRSGRIGPCVPLYLKPWRGSERAPA
ncbi:MAG: tRNA (adenosine(37)-N6)-threonylcarbamoyltransferase complex dimerization subunit type 1 TsaB [Elusimicrobiota bacterium]